MELANYEEAITDFKSVLRINPNNKVAEGQIETAKEKIKEAKKKEKNLYSQMSQMFKKVIVIKTRNGIHIQSLFNLLCFLR